ncbi:hypothetical protein [Paenibacillus sp. 32352]|uniref:hypothetical protein n=1 Tax=Paenibacillus sp. 32352 TaxID=1969111 RepID=UPI0009AD9E4F|nr:hypothetical protein [Paenibacillus sp. 32352]
MKKKWVVFGSAVGISSVVMITTGFSAMASTSGYDAYKSAFKNTKAIQNVSIQAQSVLQDNGNTLTSTNGTFKVSSQNQHASGSVTVKAGNGAEQSILFYKQAEGIVVKSSASDVYYVKQEGKEKRDWAQKHESEGMSQQVETVIDALVGNLKDYVTVNDKADGSKEVAIELNNSQIPAVVNAIAPIAIKHATSEHKQNKTDSESSTKPIPFDGHSLNANVPQLTQDIKIDKVAVKADINTNNYIEHQQADVTVSGKDAEGTAHVLTLHLNADLSGYNQTTPDTVDLTGKQVQTMKQDFRQNKEHK